MHLIDLKAERLILLACGSFNPPTRMHLNMFELARQHLQRRYNLQVVEGIMSPVADQFGKPELLPAHHRLKMAQLAAQNFDWIHADEFECSQKEWMRTMDVLEHHQQKADARRADGPKLRVVMLCGGDLVDTFTRVLPNGDPLWRIEQLRQIITNNGIVVVSRPGSTARHTVGKLALTDEERANILFVEDFEESDISSTRVRNSLRNGQPIDALVHPNVKAYILEHHLYVETGDEQKGRKVADCSKINTDRTGAKATADAPAALIRQSMDVSVVLNSLHDICDDDGPPQPPNVAVEGRQQP